jgi:long-chain acyl-CoA synthetase
VNLASVLSDAAAAYGARPALLYAGEAIAYAELERRARVAEVLLRARGVQPGDRVAIRLPNGPAFVAAWFGALRAGAIAVPLHVLLAPPEVEARLALAGPALLVSDEDELAADLDPPDEPAERADSDPAVILFTSGTSGQAKGAVLTHGGIRIGAGYARDALGLNEDDVMLGAAPFSHVLGQVTGLVSTFQAGGAVAVVPRFDGEQTLRLMTETRTTILLGVPTMCIALCDAARRATELPPVRIAHVGGAPVPVEVSRDFERTFGGEVYEGYGLTETSGVATTYTAGQPRKPGSVGTPVGDTEMRVVSPEGEPVPPGTRGEVQFRGPALITGYWKDEEATAALSADGWLATGDIGYVDSDGYLFLVDRRKEMIIRGGYNVYPREVEEALYEHPDVLEAAVVGIADARLGEEIAALVVARPGTRPEPGALRDWTRARVAAYKYPRHVLLVDTLPKGPTGKILKRDIDRAALLDAIDAGRSEPA